jgi:hypothetical protein
LGLETPGRAASGTGQDKGAKLVVEEEKIAGDLNAPGRFGVIF